MKCNEAWWDRAIRLGLGTTLLVAGVTNGWVPLVVIGVLQVATGAAGYCALYEPLGVDTTRWAAQRARKGTTRANAHPVAARNTTTSTPRRS